MRFTDIMAWGVWALSQMPRGVYGAAAIEMHSVGHPIKNLDEAELDQRFRDVTMAVEELELHQYPEIDYEAEFLKVRFKILELQHALTEGQKPALQVLMSRSAEAVGKWRGENPNYGPLRERIRNLDYGTPETFSNKLRHCTTI